MYESVNELLRVRKTGEDGGERGDQGTGKKQRGNSGGKARWNLLERCRVTSEVVNISKRETSKGDEEKRKKVIWEEKTYREKL